MVSLVSRQGIKFFYRRGSTLCPCLQFHIFGFIHPLGNFFCYIAYYFMYKLMGCEVSNPIPNHGKGCGKEPLLPGYPKLLSVHFSLLVTG